LFDGLFQRCHTATNGHGVAGPACRMLPEGPFRGTSMRLDAKSVAALTLDGKSDVIHFDDALAGFGFRLRRGAGGKLLRSWVVQYRRAGASRRMLLGSAEVLNAEQARRMAKTALARVAMGENPQAERVDRRGKDKLSFRSVVEEYLPLKQDQVRPKTFHELARYLTGAYFKPLHSMPVDTITRKDVAAQLVAISRQRGKRHAGAHDARGLLLVVLADGDHRFQSGHRHPAARPDEAARARLKR